MASRAHSFKENFLNVFGSSGGGSGATLASAAASGANDSNTDTSFDDYDKSSMKNNGKLLQSSKKTNSTDNIIDFVTTSSNTIADPRSTEVMVREVNLALRYFQDAVGKGTFELLPGCATVVLETVLALQSYAMSRRDPRSSATSNKKWNAVEMNSKISMATKAMCSSVAKLTQWADRVITDGCVDPSEDYVNQVIEPVRSAVNTVASNLLAISVVPKSTSFHNSLPDLASPERPEKAANNAVSMPTEKRPPAPALPPKSKSQSQSDTDSVDPVISSASDTNAHVDWFSNPLFDTETNLNSRRHRNRSGGHHHRHHHHNKKRSSRAFSESSELDTTLPDFCRPQRMSVCSQQAANVTLVPLATSSPRDYASSSTSSDIPPALPRKNRQQLPPPPASPNHQHRKVSTYDNVFLPPSPFATGSSLATFQTAGLSLDQTDNDEIKHNNAGPPPLPPKKKHIMSYMEMFGRSLVTTDEELVQSLTRTKDLLEAVWQQNYHDYSYNSMSSQYDLSNSQGQASSYGKHHLSSQSRHHHDLAHTTFQFSGMGVRPTTVLRTSMSSYHLPPPELPPPPPPPLLQVAAQPVSGMPPPFPNLPDDDDNQGDLEDDDDPTTDDIYPPALPPKRGPLSSRSWTSQSVSQGMSSTPTSQEDRIIPIVLEGRSHYQPYRQESTCSAPAAPTCTSTHEHRNYNQHRFSDSMTSSTSSSGFGTDIHSLRHSLPSPVMEAGGATSSSSQHQLMSESQQINDSQPSILSKQGVSRKSKTKETSPSASKAKRNSSKKKKNALTSSTSSASGSVLDQIDVRKACLDMLVYTSSSGAPPDADPSKGGSKSTSKELLRAGSVDALIVLATQSVKNDFLYQEAFIATYRTFVPTLDLLEKLVQRFRRFNNRRDDRAQQQMIYKRVAHCAFSLMVS